MNIRDLLGKKILFFDGGMGSMLQENGLKPGELPELMCITAPDVVTEIHRKYYEAGSNIVTTNTFGANRYKLKNTGYEVGEVISAATACAKKARNSFENKDEKFIALDLGPTGKLIRPFGELTFEQVYETYKEVAMFGEQSGADLVIIETMMDVYEMKAAVLAVKENTSLPIFATFTFDENGKLLMGGDIEVAVAVLEGLNVDVLGINCSHGPEKIKLFVKELMKYTSIPVIVNPNAGMPKIVDGEAFYDVSPEDFAKEMLEIAELGAYVIGGCCGTTPKHIQKTVEICKNIQIKALCNKERTVVASYSKAQVIGEKPVIIGERINPTGKKKFKEALKNKDIDYVVEQGFLQKDAGADILDVNVGLPEINEGEMMTAVVKELQSLVTLPLQIDTSDEQVMDRAMRLYNGKPLVNSVNGKEESMKAIFPLVKKYGGVVVALTLDEDGIPETARGRLEIAKKIVKIAESYGIEKKDIIIDPLTLTISAMPDAALITLESVRLIKKTLGVKTVLGVSNISFGLPNREAINASFLSMALSAELDAAIINPCVDEMMKSYYAYNALSAYDAQCGEFIKRFGNVEQDLKENAEITLKSAIIKGLDTNTYELTKKKLEEYDANCVVTNDIVPALEEVGNGFETKKVFLPQLLKSAQAAQASFEAIKEKLEQSGEKREYNGKIIMATVEGDIHDIGKNIVKVMLENYGYEVIDLGKDVKPEIIADTIEKEKVKLVGLSALMTTTVPAMKRTIELIHERKLCCKIMVGGAVLTEEYAKEIKADYYSKDAMGSVKIAQEVL